MGIAKIWAAVTIRDMDLIQLIAIEKDGLRPLPVPENATSFDQLFEGLALGVYSALRTFEHNKFLYLEHHIQRTRGSAILLGWKDVLNEPLLRQGLHLACTQYSGADARVRFDLLAAPPTHLGVNGRLPRRPSPTFHTIPRNVSARRSDRFCA